MASRFDQLVKKHEAKKAATGANNVNPQSRFGRLARYREKASPDVADIDRILDLPIIPDHAPHEVEDFSRAHLLAQAFERGARFLPTQSSAIASFLAVGGGFFPIGVGWGKCILGDTEVYDVAAGRRRRVDELGTLTVPAVRERDMSISAHRAVAMRSGRKHCVRVHLAAGQEVGASTDHRILTRDRGWVQAASLTTDDWVATPRTLPSPHTHVQIRDEEIILIAYLLSDGNTTDHHMRFTQMPGPVAEEFQRVVEVLGGSTSVATNSNSGRADDYNIVGLRPWSRSWSLSGHSAHNKRLPAALYGMDERQIGLFLSRFWACDGWLEKDRASVALCNRLLLEDLRFLLSRLGISSRVTYKPVGQHSAWTLVVSSGSNLAAFREALVEIPGKPWRFEDRPRKNVNYDGDVRWVRVKKVEDIGWHDVFDLSVPGPHNFVANGIVVHNTGISLYIAELAYKAGTKKIMLLVPPQVYAQLTKKDVPFWRRMVNLSVPLHRLGGKSLDMRRRIYQAGRKGLYIVPYSLLSVKDTLEMLSAIDPDLVIADEAHNLKNKRAARTKRLMGWKNWREEQGRPPRFVAMSGTITSKSIDDYHHLISWALGDQSPLPRTGSLAYAWSQVIDSGSSVVGEFQTGPLRPLVKWASSNFSGEVFRDTVSDFRRAFKLRLTTAPGVVSTGDAEIKTSLIVETADCPKPGHDLLALMLKVKDDFQTPNGDEIDHAIHTFKWLNELSAGFYNELVWPEVERIVTRTDLNVAQAEAALKKAKEHHARQQLYHKELRSFLQSAPLGMDTPMEVARQINQHPDRLPAKLVLAYENMKIEEEESIEEFGLLVEREGRIHRVDSSKVDRAIDWAKKLGHGCILWFWHNGVGQWLRDVAKAAKLDVLYCPAGDDANEKIIDEANAGKVVIASMGAHGTGKNLQHFQHQLFVQWPRDAKLAEQVLGRVHRNGQQADEITAHRFDANSFDTVNFAATLNDSVYIHQSTGQRQKLVYAVHNPMPRVFSPEFLREQGADPAKLNAEQRGMMEDLFGADWEDAI